MNDNNLIHAKPTGRDLLLGKNASISMDHKLTSRNCNLVVIDGSESQFRALINANLKQASCNYVVLTTSVEEFDTVSTQLVHSGYNVYAFDTTMRVHGNERPPSQLLSNSIATAIFILFDPDIITSCIRAGELLSQTFDDLYDIRVFTTGEVILPHIQFFLDGIVYLPFISSLSRCLLTGKDCSIGVAFYIPDRESFAAVYSGLAEEILKICDIKMIYTKIVPRRFLQWLLGYIPLPQYELLVAGTAARWVIPFVQE